MPHIFLKHIISEIFPFFCGCNVHVSEPSITVRVTTFSNSIFLYFFIFYSLSQTYPTILIFPFFEQLGIYFFSHSTTFILKFNLFIYSISSPSTKCSFITSATNTSLLPTFIFKLHLLHALSKSFTIC